MATELSRSVISVAAKTLVGLQGYSVGLPVIGTQSMPEILPRLHFQPIYLEDCGLSRLSVP